MVLQPLATEADLSARKVDTSDATLIAALLSSASAAVREAAGCSISEATGTVVLSGGAGRYLRLPGWAISGVESVSVDGVAVTDWRLVDGRLFRRQGWGDPCDPPEVVVTYTQGVATVPEDIVNLVCSLVAAGVAAAEDGFDPHRGISSERIDDYQRSFTRGDDEVVDPLDLPERTRSWLARRFGGGSYVTGELL